MSGTVTSPDIATPTSFITATTIFYGLLIPAVVLWYAYWRISRRHMFELLEKIPGPAGLPLIGNALEFVGNSHSKICICCETIGFKIYVPSNRYLPEGL